MFLILRCRRVGPNIYRIKYKTTGVADETQQKNQISEGELRRWLKFDSWSLREAAQLSCNQRPDQTNRTRTHAGGRITKKSAGGPGAVARKSGSNELGMMTDLFRRARRIGLLGDPVKPAVFIAWLREKHPETNLARIMDEDLRQRSTKLVVLSDQTPGSNRMAAEANKLRISHRILLALAVKYTSYDDKDNKKSIDAIIKAIDDCQMKIDRETVKRHLSEAYSQNVDELRASRIFKK